MLGADATQWTLWTWILYALAAYYAVGLVVFWVRFQRAERRAKHEGGAAVVRYNRLLRGWPNLVYAKMFGKRPFEVAKVDDKGIAPPDNGT